jgi:hypothetical protein
LHKTLRIYKNTKKKPYKEDRQWLQRLLKEEY